jgi:hypothetical protein
VVVKDRQHHLFLEIEVRGIFMHALMFSSKDFGLGHNPNFLDAIGGNELLIQTLELSAKKA